MIIEQNSFFSVSVFRCTNKWKGKLLNEKIYFNCYLFLVASFFSLWFQVIKIQNYHSNWAIAQQMRWPTLSSAILEFRFNTKCSILCKYTSEYTGSLCVSDSHWKFPLFCMCLTLCHEDVKQSGYSDWSERVQCMCSRYSMLHNRFNLWTRIHTYNVYRCRPLHLFNTKESFYSSIWRRG